MTFLNWVSQRWIFVLASSCANGRTYDLTTNAWHGKHVFGYLIDKSTVPQIWFHMTSLKFKLQNYWFSSDFTFMMYKSSWKLIFVQIFAPSGFLVLAAWRGVYMTGKKAVMLVERVTYFGEFGYLNSSCIRKTIIFKMFLSSWRDKFTLLYQNSMTDVSVVFRPPSRWAPGWRLHQNLYKFG